MNSQQHKPTIETVINTAAIALTSFGVIAITKDGRWEGYISILFAVGLEWFKYYGRQKSWW